MKLGKELAIAGYFFGSKSNPGKTYETLIYPAGMEYKASCNCMGWAKNRICVHTKKIHNGEKGWIKAWVKEIGGIRNILPHTEDELLLATEALKVSPHPTSLLPTKKIEEIVRDFFIELREYGFICFQNMPNRRWEALESLKKHLAGRDIETIAGIVWTDRYNHKQTLIHEKTFIIEYAYPHSTFEENISELLGRHGIMVEQWFPVNGERINGSKILVRIL